MEIAVFGSTGRTGSAVVERALARGHLVRAFARSPQKVTIVDPGLRVVVGDASDTSAVKGAVAGAQAVISAMGTPGLEPSIDLSTVTAHVIAAMDAAADPARLAVVLNERVFHVEDAAPPYTHVVSEHKRNLAALRVSGLAWVGACPGFITDDEAAGAYEAVIDRPAGVRGISRFDLADFLIDAVESRTFVGHPVGVGACTSSS